MTVADAQAIKSDYARALAHQKAGEEEAALDLYGRIIARNANIPEVHFQVARIFLRAGRLDRALRHIEAAATLKPAVADIWTVWAEAVATLSDADVRDAFLARLKQAPIEKRTKSAIAASVAFRSRSKAPPGGLPEGKVRAVRSALDAGRFDEAERLAADLVRRHGGSGLAHDLHGVALAANGRFEEAVAEGRTAVAREPAYPEARVNLARALRRLGRPAEAVQELNAALRMAPGLASALLARADCESDQGMSREAGADYRRARDADPSRVEAHVGLAQWLIEEERDYLAAEEVLDDARRRGLDSLLMRQTRGLVEAELGRPEAALAEYDALRRMDPAGIRGLVRSAELKQSLGRFDEAEAEFREAIRRQPDRGETYRIFLTSKRIDPDDPLVAEMDRRFRDEALPAESRAHFGFALAKVMEDAKRHDRVFEYLHPANALIRSLRPYDSGQRAELARRLLDAFAKVDWHDPAFMSDVDYAPIFVTGMPRSGTTLVEQIIASHSTVGGAGEVSLAAKQALRLLGGETASVRPVAEIAAEEYRALGAAYADTMRRHFPGNERHTDKSIQTFGYIGILKRALPKARFIVVRRDPRDNLLSIYKNVFPEMGHRYAYNLTDLAEYYHQFVAMVEFWKEVAPDWIHEVQYEELVADPEAQSRALIAAAGLDWEDACLDFHRSDRRVKTLSLYQVRQPIYASSTKAWERYRGELDEMFRALGEPWSDAAE